MTQNIKHNVIATNIDDKRMSLYTDKGTVLYIKQGDPRLIQILNEATIAIFTKGSYEYEHITDADPLGTSPYKLIEEFTNKQISFFNATEAVLNRIQEKMDMLDKKLEEVAELKQLKTSEPIHALVDGVIVPNIDRLENSIINITTQGNTEGVANLIKRLANMNKKREHSAEDLLDFLKHAKLPITKDGNIVFIKSVNKSGNVYVDCHTGTIKQSPGTLVYMDESLVDPDRTRDCSNGLHVACIKYASTFWGSAMLVGIVYPEDVIAVPEYDHTKMRVSSYYVLDSFSDEDNSTIRREHTIDACSDSLRKKIQSIVEGNYNLKPYDYAHIVKNVPLEVEYGNYETEKVKLKEADAPVVALKEKEHVTKAVAPKVRLSEAKKVKSQRDVVLDLIANYRKLKTNNAKKKVAVDIIAIKSKAKFGWGYVGVDKDLGREITLLSK